MSDDIRDTVVLPAAKEARDRRGHRAQWIAFAGAIVGILVLGALFFTTTGSLKAELDAVSTSATENHSAAQTLAEQVRQLGGTPKVQPPGPAGATGPSGPAGRGITGTAISSGHLYVSYTDGVTEDKGQVVGKDGSAGTDGRGITGSTVASGHLILSYSDNTTQDAGQVVGQDGAKGDPGRGVKSMDGSSGHLVVTYDDGTTQDVGPLPVGPAGPKGDPGPACPAGYEQHEAVITANDGTKYDGVACVKPDTATTTTTPPPLLGNGRR